MTFFLDHCISFRVAHLLRVLREDVHALREKFPDGAPDEVWIPDVAARGWVIVTADRAIKSTPHLRRILHDSRVTAFFLARPFVDQKLWDLAVSILSVWPKIKEAADQAKQGDSYLVYITGKVEPFPEDTTPAMRPHNANP